MGGTLPEDVNEGMISRQRRHIPLYIFNGVNFQFMFLLGTIRNGLSKDGICSSLIYIVLAALLKHMHLLSLLVVNRSQTKEHKHAL